MTDLATWRTDLGFLIGSGVDSATWTTSVLDEALRNGLRLYTDRGPISEESLTVEEAGSQIDLDTVADFYSCVGLAWPWSDRAVWEQCAVRWRPLGPNTVYLLDGMQVRVGDQVRVRYRKWYGIATLSGTGTGSVHPVHERIVLLASALWLLSIRIRQIAENPAIPKEAGRALKEQRESWQKELDERLAALAGLLPNPVWGNLGL